MTKQSNYLKNSFIFLEALVSLVIVSIIVTTFFKLSLNKSSDETFIKINKLSNNFIKEDYKDFSISENQKLKFLMDGVETSILVNKITYQDSDIKLIKYENK